MIDPLNPDFKSLPIYPNQVTFHYELNGKLQPVVTIATPFYNTGDIFHDTAKSILNQSLQQFEWLIINDGSSDDRSLEVLNQYRKLGDPRIRIVNHPKNLGLSAARNTGFKEAKTEYVLMIDSDDLLEPTAAEKWVWFLESFKEYHFVNGYSIGFGIKEYLWRNGFINHSLNLEENKIDHTSLVRKKIFESGIRFDESMKTGCEDWDFWLSCASQGFWGHTIPDFLSWYRTREDHSKEWSTLSEDGLNQVKNKFKQKYPKLYQKGMPQISLLWHYPNEIQSIELPFSNSLLKKKKRLLLLIPWLSMGGADQFNINLIKKLTLKDWEVTIVTSIASQDKWQGEFAKFTSDIFKLHEYLKLSDYSKFIKYIIHSRQPDAILISNSELFYQFLPFIYSIKENIPIFDYCHSITPNWKNGGYPNLSVINSPFIDKHIVSSKNIKEWMVLKGVDVKKIEVVTINIDSQEWYPDPVSRNKIRESMGIDKDTPIIIFTGRIAKEKQPLVLGYTLKKLKDNNLDFVALIIGEGEEEEELKSFIVNNNLENTIKLLGAVSNKSVKKYLAASDIFFLPSEYEGISLSIYEAMSTGLCIVASDVGGQKELVSKDCGFLVKRSNQEDETENYNKIISNLIRSKDYGDLGSNARKRIERFFDIEFMVSRMEHIFLTKREPSKAVLDLFNSNIASSLSKYFAYTTIEYLRLEKENNFNWLNGMENALKKNNFNASIESEINKSPINNGLKNAEFNMNAKSFYNKLGNYIKKIYNWRISNEKYYFPLLIKKIGYSLLKIGHDLINIDKQK